MNIIGGALKFRYPSVMYNVCFYDTHTYSVMWKSGSVVIEREKRLKEIGRQRERQTFIERERVESKRETKRGNEGEG